MRRTPALATIVLAAGLAFTGCSTSSTPEEDGSSPSSSPSAEAKVRYDLEQGLPQGDYTLSTFGIGAGDYNAHNVRVEDGW